jgi:hypothetical protein
MPNKATHTETELAAMRDELAGRYSTATGDDLAELELELGRCPAHAYARRVLAGELLTVDAYRYELSLRGLASWPVPELVARYDADAGARDTIRRELERRWNGEAELLELERGDILETPAAVAA